jgi:hypothetical protein
MYFITRINHRCTTICRMSQNRRTSEPLEGILKPLSAAGFIATFAGLIYHYVGVGPNKETDDDEEENGHE